MTAVDSDFDELSAKHTREAHIRKVAEDGRAAFERASAWAAAPAGTPYGKPAKDSDEKEGQP